MTPPLRKLLLTTHVVVSIGWFGAAAGVLALGIAALTHTRSAPGMYEATAVIWRAVILPLSIAALVTGVVQAFATQWGLFRHYWVVTKLVITVGAVLLLLLHTRSMLPELLRAAIDSSTGVADGAAHGHGGMSARVHLVVASGGTLLLLAFTAILSVYKPWGRTGAGRRSAVS